MSIRVYPSDEIEEKALLEFLESRHHRYQSSKENLLSDSKFIKQYNQDVTEAEAALDAGDFLTHDQLKALFTR